MIIPFADGTIEFRLYVAGIEKDRCNTIGTEIRNLLYTGFHTADALIDYVIRCERTEK